MMLEILIMVCVAIVIDLVIGDPRRLPHPVVGMGWLIAALEKRWNHGAARARCARGTLLTTVVVVLVFALAWGVLAGLARIHPALGIAAEVWLLATTLATKGLRDAALAVATPLAQGDLIAARQALAMIVGRDTEGLGESDITRATVETVAENTVDGITAPLFFALIGGAPLALTYKAVNTLDSMVGYRNARYADFGYVSAKLDDLANWLPARLTAVTIWLAAFCLSGSRRRGALKGALPAALREAPNHPSPNAGWPEAIVANLLGVQLGGTNYYAGVASHRAHLGEPLEPLSVQHISRAIALMHGGWLVFLLLMSGVVLFREVLFREMLT
ncbi:adenosylcobinamide-phosphate synthase CbiB [Vreelandella salicampi]|uniref:Cobalamin biosynthesis protein CobD n=1 Tax=Vreelandella salicampi TaxID=1449798 RepID=A0A7Z0LNQ5_9GAMM|nr:adenosylcobinamide-phosphate synthase CbiB [Halomonas salicampi]NYS62269.1 cobalamin biosynthesis protein CobD [Halomonas salicampi]